jgi:hypothetical protein
VVKLDAVVISSQKKPVALDLFNPARIGFGAINCISLLMDEVEGNQADAISRERPVFCDGINLSIPSSFG